MREFPTTNYPDLPRSRSHYAAMNENDCDQSKHERICQRRDIVILYFHVRVSTWCDFFARLSSEDRLTCLRKMWLERLSSEEQNDIVTDLRLFLSQTAGQVVFILDWSSCPVSFIVHFARRCCGRHASRYGYKFCRGKRRRYRLLLSKELQIGIDQLA